MYWLGRDSAAWNRLLDEPQVLQGSFQKAYQDPLNLSPETLEDHSGALKAHLEPDGSFGDIEVTLESPEAHQEFDNNPHYDICFGCLLFKIALFTVQPKGGFGENYSTALTLKSDICFGCLLFKIALFTV